MNKLFENTTAYTPEIYKEFVRFHNSKYNLQYRLYTFLILLSIAFCIVLQFSYKRFLYGFLFILVMIFFLFYRVFHPFFFIKKEANSSKIKHQLKNTYSFYNNYMEIKNKNQIIRLKYHKLHKIFNTENYFYLYINKNYSFVLAKDSFSIGNANDFYSFIKKKLWYKIF